MDMGYNRVDAGRVADVLAHAGVWPEFNKWKKGLQNLIHEPGEARDLWIRMSKDKLGTDKASELADFMLHHGWTPQQKILPKSS